jgi:hypothetical protein
VEAEPAQKILQLNDLVLSDATGFEGGHDHQLTVESSRRAGHHQI